MGAFFLVTCDDPAERTRLAGLVHGSLSQQGFVSPVHIEHRNTAGAVYGTLDGQPATVAGETDTARSFCSGTLIYRGATGASALQSLHDDLTDGEPDWPRLHGSFCAVINKHDRLTLFTDRVGTYRVYLSQDGSVISSSFLAVLAATPQATPAAQQIYEFVFQGAFYGDATVVDEISMLDGDSLVRIEDGVRVIPVRHAVADDDDPIDRVQSKQNCLAALRDVFAAIKSCYGNAVDTALSGGYDSRLVFALLREQGIDPRLHVYGSASDPDVSAAKTIAAGEGLALNVIDKSTFASPSAEDFAAVVRQNHLTFDGLPADGIFESGADRETRFDRSAGGALMLNGGGGEIFRNFFYLPDRPFTTRQLVHAFYNRYDPGTATEAFREDTYLERLADKIRTVLGAPAEPLSRRHIELVYPLFRCRYWMGRNNSVNNRIGAAMTPLVTVDTVRAAAPIAIAHKNDGAFEAELIADIDTRLAEYPTDTGNALNQAPPLGHRIASWTVRMRPPFLRKYSFRIQHRRMQKDRSGVLSDRFVGRVLDLSFPHMSAFFHTDKIMSREQYNRLCTLEYLFAQFRTGGG